MTDVHLDHLTRFDAMFERLERNIHGERGKAEDRKMLKTGLAAAD